MEYKSSMVGICLNDSKPTTGSGSSIFSVLDKIVTLTRYNTKASPYIYI